MSKTSQEVEVHLSYSLFDLPTAQHKAGLAGLLLLIQSMRQRGFGSLPVVDDLTSTSVSLTITRRSLQAIFDDLYDAEWREAPSKVKWKGKAPKREEPTEVTDPKTGKIKKSKLFIYDVVVPKASFLEHHYPGDETGWLKLWRDMIWNVLRGIPTTRAVYEERAEKKPSREADSAWNELAKFCLKKQKGELHIADIQSSLFIGAQASNAERVPFRGRADHGLLLHFWPLAIQVFVPEIIDRDGSSEISGQAYIVAVPEVSDLKEFSDVFPHSLAGLDPQMRGYRPRASVVDLPAEGALEFLRHLTLIAQQKAAGGELRYSISAIELFHLEKRGNSIKMLEADRIVPHLGLLGHYEAVRAYCRNPFFKTQLLLNLLRGLAWYDGFVLPFAEYPWEFFVRSNNTPNTLPFFSSDVRKQFEILSGEFQSRMEVHSMAESTTPRPQSLEKRIYDMIGAYVRHKAETKSGTKWADFKDKKGADGKMAIPSVYIEARQKVCADIFLGMRSRRDQDFVEYFTGTICSVPQFLLPDDYVFVSQALLEDGGWEKIKALSMLALAAHS